MIPIITAFTLGHSVTLIGTAYDLAPIGAWFRPFIETAIAASIVYMALENIIGANLGQRWIITGLFGLVHGFGFADALKEQLQFAGSYLLVSLLSLNVGIEIGHLAVLCVFVPALALFFRGRMSGRMGIVVLSAIIAHTAWHWMIDRGEVLWQTPWPQIIVPGVSGSSASGRGSVDQQKAGLRAEHSFHGCGQDLRRRFSLLLTAAACSLPRCAIVGSQLAVT